MSMGIVTLMGTEFCSHQRNYAYNKFIMKEKEQAK